MRFETLGSRLSVLALVTATLLAAGCPKKSGGGGEASPTPDASATPSATPTPSAKPQVSVPPAEKRFARAYELSVKLSGGGLPEGSQTYTLRSVRRPRGTDERFALEVVGGGGFEVSLDGSGEFKGGSDPWLDLLLHSLVETPGLKPRGEARNLYLPHGGWLRQEHKLEESAPAEFAGRLGTGTKVSGRFRGERASGEALRGNVGWEHWVDAETGEVLAIRARIQLQFKDHGVRKLTLELLPKGEAPKDAAPSAWLESALGAPIEVELAAPLIGSLTLAASVAVAAKASPRLFAPVAPFALTLGGLAAKSPAQPGQPPAGKVVAKREEPARSFVTYLPTPSGGRVQLAPVVLEDGADRVIVIQAGDRRRAVYADDALWGQAKEGEDLDVSGASGVDQPQSNVAGPTDKELLEGADAAGQAVIVR